MAIIKEFRDFIKRGNVVELAVGLIMGAAFGRIVNSLVADVLMPPIGALIAGIDLKQLAYEFNVATINQKGEVIANPVKLSYGNFIQALVDFLLISTCIFLIVKATNRFWKKEDAKPPEPTTQEKLLTEIRDLLKERR